MANFISAWRAWPRTAASPRSSRRRLAAPGRQSQLNGSARKDQCPCPAVACRTVAGVNPPRIFVFGAWLMAAVGCSIRRGPEIGSWSRRTIASATPFPAQLELHFFRAAGTFVLDAEARIGRDVQPLACDLDLERTAGFKRVGQTAPPHELRDPICTLCVALGCVRRLSSASKASGPQYCGRSKLRRQIIGATVAQPHSTRAARSSSRPAAPTGRL